MEYEDLLLKKEDGIATITLNVPEKLNALTIKMRESLLLVVEALAKDDEVRVVILTGAGRGFCSGADVRRWSSRTTGEVVEEPRHKLVGIRGELNDIFPRINKPVIAAVNGPCIGAGFAIALGCDIRIASETARFGAGFILRGLSPDTGMSYFLPQLVGTSKALELMFTSEIISAAEAERVGIVSRVVPPDELLKIAGELAAKIAQQPPVPIELTKKIVWRRLREDLRRQVDLETYAMQICRQTEDHKESTRAFLEKRLPGPFKGK